MSSDQMMSGIWYVLVLVLVGSSLMSRRVSLSSTLGMALAWIGIFAVILGVYSYRQELGLVATRMQSEVMGTPRQQADGQALRIAQAADGHYWVDGAINGKPARFLIDSGASVTALSEETAQAVGLNIDRTRMPVVMQTANGPVEAFRSNIATLELGPVRVSDIPVVVSPAFGKINVVGMNTLSRLNSWGVRDREMILTP